MFDWVEKKFEDVCSVVMVLILVASVVTGAVVFNILLDFWFRIIIGIVIGCICGLLFDVVVFGLMAQIVSIKHLIEAQNKKIDNLISSQKSSQYQ